MIGFLSKLLKIMAVIVISAITLIPSLGYLAASVQAKINTSAAAKQNRYLSPFPRDVTSFTDLTDKLEDYLGDHYALRHLAIKAERRIKSRLGDEGGKVYRGKAGWLFLGEPLVWDTYQGRSNFSAQSLNDFETLLSDLNARSAAIGAGFVAAIVPDKASIYTEYVPERFGEKSPRNFLDYVTAELDMDALNLIDLNPIFDKHKDIKQLYYKTDTHWTPYGAWLGYQAMMGHLKSSNPKLDLIELSDLVEGASSAFHGDLSRIYAETHSGTYTELSQNLWRNTRDKYEIETLDDGNGRPGLNTVIYRRIGQEADNNSTILVIGDSFGMRYVNFLKGSYDNIIMAHHKFGQFNMDAIDVYKADSVMFMSVEKNLLPILENYDK